MDASRGPMNITEETRISARKNNHKSNHCVDPVAAMNKRWRRCCEWGAQAASVDTT
ncbi:hypothetical protein P3L10_020151 [Capsicum annuum]